MAMTETRPAAETESATTSEASSSRLPLPAGGLIGLLGTGRHRSIGRLWVGTSLVFLAASGALGSALGARRLQPDRYGVFSVDNFAQSLSLHGVGAVFLFGLPILIGLGTIVVPRQVGAHTIAFPRAAAAAYWTYLLGGGMVVVSYLINGGPGGGNEKGVDLFLASLAMVVVALVTASVCIATTVLALRVKGLTLTRVPLFAWSMLVTTTIWIASLGVLFGLLVLLYIDHRNRAFVFGANTDIDGWLRWTITQPQVYAAAIPVLGFAGDVVPVMGRIRARHYGIALGLIGAFGALSFGAWSFLAYENPRLTEQALYVAMGIAIVLPVLAFFGLMADTLRLGRPRLSSPLLFAIAALLALLAGVAGGALRVIKPLELVGTTSDSSVLHFVFGAVAIAAIGAIHYWWPHVLTRRLNEALGRATALLMLVGVLALAVPDFISGLLDEPAKSLYAGVTAEDSIKVLNGVSFAGGLIVGLAILLFVFNLATSLAKRSEDDDAVDPWDGHTLEWTADASSVTVTSASPLLDAREAAAP